MVAEDFVALRIVIVMFWVMMLCILAGGYVHFG
jgi:hypothetical protein